MKTWSVYILKCSDGTLYTGMTNNLTARIEKHNLGLGAAYTRSRKPVTLVYSETADSRSTAQIREAEIKKMNRETKLRLIESLS